MRYVRNWERRGLSGTLIDQLSKSPAPRWICIQKSQQFRRTRNSNTEVFASDGRVCEAATRKCDGFARTISLEDATWRRAKVIRDRRADRPRRTYIANSSSSSSSLREAGAIGYYYGGTVHDRLAKPSGPPSGSTVGGHRRGSIARRRDVSFFRSLMPQKVSALLRVYVT